MEYLWLGLPIRRLSATRVTQATSATLFRLGGNARRQAAENFFDEEVTAGAVRFKNTVRRRH